MNYWSLITTAYGLYSNDLIFWSLITAIGAVKVARIIYGHDSACCSDKMPLLETSSEEEYDENTPIEEEDEIKEE